MLIGGLTAILFISAGLGLFSALGSQQDQIKLYNINADHNFDAADYESYDPRADYEAISNDITIGDYSIETQMETRNQACAMDVEIAKDGSQIDSFTVVDAASLSDYAEDKNKGWREYGNIEVKFGNPTYSDNEVWRGNVYGMTCGGMFNRINYQIDWDEISMDAEAVEKPEKDKIEVGLVGENNWEDLDVDAKVEMCVAEGFCREQVIDQSIDDNGSFVVDKTFPYAEDYEFDIDGNISLSLDDFPIKGLGTGESKASQMESIRVGSINADEDITVVEAINKVRESGGTESPENTTEERPPEGIDFEENSVIDRITSFLSTVPVLGSLF